jgi:hypothetical protein
VTGFTSTKRNNVFFCRQRKRKRDRGEETEGKRQMGRGRGEKTVGIDIRGETGGKRKK